LICKNKFLSLHAQIYLSAMENAYIVPVNGLTPGKTEFNWRVGKEFFEEFGNTEVLDADLEVVASVEKSGHYIGVDCDMKGFLTVACDRCLSDLKIPIEPHIRLSVKYEGQELPADDNEREVISLPSDDADLDLSQIIYDYACLAIPMHRVHPEGECDSVMTGYIGKNDRADDTSSPFDSLKGMFD